MNSNYYRGNPYQRGYGVGGTFRRFFSWIVPLFKQHALPVINEGVKEVGLTALSTASDILKDTTNGRNIKSSIKERVDQAVDNIKEKVERKLRGGRSNMGIKRSDKAKKKKDYILIKKRKQLKDIFE